MNDKDYYIRLNIENALNSMFNDLTDITGKKFVISMPDIQYICQIILKGVQYENN